MKKLKREIKRAGHQVEDVVSKAASQIESITISVKLDRERDDARQGEAKATTAFKTAEPLLQSLSATTTNTQQIQKFSEDMAADLARVKKLASAINNAKEDIKNDTVIADARNNLRILNETAEKMEAALKEIQALKSAQDLSLATQLSNLQLALSQATSNASSSSSSSSSSSNNANLDTSSQQPPEIIFTKPKKPEQTEESREAAQKFMAYFMSEPSLRKQNLEKFKKPAEEIEGNELVTLTYRVTALAQDYFAYKLSSTPFPAEQMEDMKIIETMVSEMKAKQSNLVSVVVN